MAELSIALNGVTALPAGTIAAIVTDLERLAPPAAGEFPALADRDLDGLGRDVPRYRALYAEIGEPWLWFSRRRLADEALSGILGDPGVEAFALREDGRDVGLLEIDWRRADEAEIVFFGLVPSRAGRGIGRALMGEALRRAWARPIRRAWLHPCTLDHPAALGCYVSCGFTCVRRHVEVAPDPRLAGALPRSAGAHHPVLEREPSS